MKILKFNLFLILFILEKLKYCQGSNNDNIINEINLYKEYYKRNPFIGFNDWIKFASKKNCSTKPLFYDAIEKTLNYFRSSKNPNQRTITKEQLELTKKN